MSSLLFVGLVILAVLLFDARSRLKRLEERFADEIAHGRASVAPHMQPVQAKQSARIVPDLPPLPSQVAHPDPLPIEPVDTEPLPDPAERAPVEREAAMLAQDVAVDPDDTLILPPCPDRASAPSPAQGGGFEELFGRKLPIWGGGVTLAVAGVLLVKYSIDAGLLSPFVRVLLGVLFGGGLIGGAEWLLRKQDVVQDARVHQALAGAGIASLYASVLAASNLYGLIGGGLAFAGLTATTALAMGLSLRFGAPSALLGLAGGLAAPALVSAGPPNVPLLCAYLALAIGGLTTVSRRQRWLWLGIAALIGGAGWSGVLILTGALDFASTLSAGLLVMLLGLGLPLFAFSGGSLSEGAGRMIRGGAAVVAAGQIAALVAKGGFAPLEWGLYLLLSAAIVFLASRDRTLRLLPPVGLAVGLLLIALWPNPSVVFFTLVMLGLGLLYGGAALWQLWRPNGTIVEAGQVVGLALVGHAIALVHYFQPGGEEDGLFALLSLAVAALPAGAAALGWHNEQRREDARFAALSLASALLLADAGIIGFANWFAPVVLAVLAAALLLLARRAEDRRIDCGALTFLIASITAMGVTGHGDQELRNLVGEDIMSAAGQALVRWTGLAGVTGLFAWRCGFEQARIGFGALAALAAYGLVAQIVPAPWLAIASGLMLVGTAEATRQRAQPSLWAGCAALAGLVLLWALEPCALWLIAALPSLGGEAMLASDLPTGSMAFRLLVVPVALLLVALWRLRPLLPLLLARVILVGTAVLAGVGLHIVYKQLFHLVDAADVAARGLAERTVWEALLLGAGYAMWRRGRFGRGAVVPVVGAVAHSLWYTMILFNPLLREVAVGSLPAANLLLPAFAVPAIGLWMAERIVPGLPPVLRRVFDGLRMILIILFAYMTLRQLFCGSILTGLPVEEVENIGWSVLAILLAIGFLLWGIRRGLHDWRIASLLLMLGAVAKVFLFDASGLTGLLRILSFLALGFSLIGLGWLYSRFLGKGAVG